MSKGAKTGGRQKGTPNKRQSGILKMLREMDCDPLIGMAKMAKGEVDCLHCDESGKMSMLKVHQLFGIKPKEEMVAASAEMLIKCPICDGTKIEKIQQKIRADMYKELSQYVAPKRRSVEHSGSISGAEKTPDVNITLKNG